MDGRMDFMTANAALIYSAQPKTALCYYIGLRWSHCR